MNKKQFYDHHIFLIPTPSPDLLPTSPDSDLLASTLILENYIQNSERVSEERETKSTIKTPPSQAVRKVATITLNCHSIET
jgi:hypothetical protein